MAVTFVGVSAETTNNAAIPVPSGTAGDLLVLSWESDTGTDHAAASGWTDIGAGATGFGGAGHKFGALWKLDATTGGGTQTFTGLNTGVFTDCFIARYSGVHQTTPINASGLDANTSTVSSITSTVANCVEFVSVTSDSGYSAGVTPPTGFTLRLDGSGANDCAFDRAQAVAGATGTTTTPADTTSSTNKGIVHLLIAPSSTAETGYDVARSMPRGMIPPTGFMRDTYSYIETVVVPVVNQPWAQTLTTSLITPSSAAASVFRVLLPGFVETVPVPWMIGGTALPQPLQVVQLVPGQLPGISETVPVPILVRADALRITPYPSLAFVALQTGNAPVTSFNVGVIQSLALPGPPALGQVFVALQAGTAPVTAFYVPFIASSASPIPLSTAVVVIGEYPPLVSTVPVVPYTRGVPFSVPGASSLLVPGLHPSLVETVPVIPVTYGVARSIAMANLTVLPGITIGTPPTVFTFVPTIYGTAIAVQLPDKRVYLGLLAGNAPPLDPTVVDPFTTLIADNLTFTVSDSGLAVVRMIDPTTLTVMAQMAEYDAVADPGGTKE